MKNEEYLEIRKNGLYSCYVVHTLVKKLRAKYSIPENGTDYVYWLATYKIAKVPEVTILARHLELDPIELQYYIVTNSKELLTTTMLSTIENDDNTAGIFRSDDDYLPPGMYVKVDANTTKEMVISRFQRAKRRLDQIKKSEDKHRVQISYTDVENTEYHHALEQKLIEIMRDPEKTRETYSGPFEDQLVKMAVEQTAGEIIDSKYGEDDETDHLNEEIALQSHVRDRYYKFVKRYRLPTIRDLSILLRLTGL